MLLHNNSSAHKTRWFGSNFARLLAAISIVVLASGLVAGGKAWSLRRRVSPFSVGAQTPPQFEAAAAQPSESPQRIEVVRITVRPTGFEPNEISYPDKPFLLAIDNQSGSPALALKLEFIAGNSERTIIRNVTLSRGRLRDTGLISPHPGRYVLTETQHPEWSCRITISPH